MSSNSSLIKPAVNILAGMEPKGFSDKCNCLRETGKSGKGAAGTVPNSDCRDRPSRFFFTDSVCNFVNDDNGPNEPVSSLLPSKFRDFKFCSKCSRPIETKALCRILERA